MSSPVQLTSTQIANEAGSLPNLYEWSGGQLQLLSLMPGAEKGSTHLTVAGGGNSFKEGLAARHAISATGNSILMEEVPEVSSRATGLYLRDVAKAETLRLDVAQEGLAEPGFSFPQYMTASTDGSHIFFLDAARLTSDSGARQKCFLVAKGPECEEQRPDLYECAISADPGTGKDRCTLTDLTPTSAEPACVAMVLGASEDGSYVYFMAGGALAPSAVGDPECSIESPNREDTARNLYERHGGVTRLVARLAAKDREEWERLGQEGLTSQSVRVSPNGHWLAFMSNRTTDGV